ncbi:MAG: amidophosphoribosyltransferase [Nanoarchaeota archaeon]|nr:amidophosphoribosyltransferase [Nanoarchaeota archaeon]MBU1269989.1 amidophosphoribosyltransferase [Nanoarchaeota archaeon]MBU1604411.1 amidophosphoribosyltransferase [Nanoarchaeota archaeon]MBU2442587.1 amidophosphoribosyltransferase [Nanoarchaeota archaeon]
MCGIIGIINNDEVNVKLFYSLISLQHRGQDAAGMITSQGNELFVRKDLGLVQEIFNIDNITKFKGNIGIGQTRYSTIGSASKENSQPLFINSNDKIALAHNGNVTNYTELKELLAKQHIFFTTTVDLEPVLHLFTIRYNETKDFFEAAKYIMQTIKGAYSIVGIIAGKGLFAIRDPHGIRPLALGKKNDTYAFASESIVFQTLEYEFVRDIAPGEAVFIHDKTLDVESRILLQKEKAHCMFEWIYFSRPESMIEERAVYKSRLALGVTLAEKLKGEDIDVVIPVPDTARSCAIKLAEELGVKYREGLIKNRYVGRTFIMPSQTSRKYTMNIKLAVIISVVRDRIVAVVDDSVVRGTTSKRIIKLLRDAGAKKIIFISSCPPIKHPCFYGIDMSTPEELIANNKTIEETRKFIGADKLIYTEVDDLKKAIRRDLCCACLNGKYPVELSTEEKSFFVDDKKFR